MEHTIGQIIKNQNLYKQQIIDNLSESFMYAKKELNTIETDDKFILKEKKRWVTKFKKFNTKKFIERLFFLHPSRSKHYYAWWNDNKQEVLILSYEDEDQ